MKLGVTGTLREVVHLFSTLQGNVRGWPGSDFQSYAHPAFWARNREVMVPLPTQSRRQLHPVSPLLLRRSLVKNPKPIHQPFIIIHSLLMKKRKEFDAGNPWKSRVNGVYLDGSLCHATVLVWSQIGHWCAFSDGLGVDARSGHIIPAQALDQILSSLAYRFHARASDIQRQTAFPYQYMERSSPAGHSRRVIPRPGIAFPDVKSIHQCPRFADSSGNKRSHSFLVCPSVSNW